MWTKPAICLFLLLAAAPSIRAESLPDASVVAEQFRVGPLYTHGAGDVSVVVELPYGITAPDPSSFSLRFDGRPDVTASEVKTFLSSGNELSWLICVDVSGSMAGAPLRDTKMALHTFLSDSRALRIGLMTFGSKIGRPRFADTRQKLTRELDGLNAAGARSRTRLYQALYQALDFYEEQAKPLGLPERRRILVISDGKDEGSSASADSVIQRSIALRIPVDAVARSRIQDQYAESLRHLAAGTGGRFVDARSDLVSLTDALTRIYRELMETQTVVAYFRYRPGAPEEVTDKVRVALRWPGGEPLEGTIKAEIALPQAAVVETTKPAETIKPVEKRRAAAPAWAMWLLTGVLLLLLAGAAVFLLRRQREASAGDTKEPRKTPVVSSPVSSGEADASGSPAPSPKIVAFQTGESRRKTVVGGYFPRPGPGSPAAVLLGVSGPMQGVRVPIEKEELLIGASEENDLVISDDGYVSRSHARIRYENGSLFIYDEHSRNGTFVNDKRLAANAQVLMPGDSIRVGGSQFQLIQ